LFKVLNISNLHGEHQVVLNLERTLGLVAGSDVYITEWTNFKMPMISKPPSSKPASLGSASLEQLLQ